MESNFIDNIKLPKTLNLPKETTFGVEIEFEKANLSKVEGSMDNARDKRLLSSGWHLSQDDSLFDHGHFTGFGGEMISPILHDKIEDYKEIRNACHIIKTFNGEATSKCGGHIHIGANILKDNLKYYIRLAKLWSVFEPEIIRFALGEDIYTRENMSYYAQSSASVLRHIYLIENKVNCNGTFEDFIRFFGFDKKMAISFFNLNSNRPFKTIEVRCPNGTIEPVIWKNNINFFTNLLHACTNDKLDWNKIQEMYLDEIDLTPIEFAEKETSIDKALFLANFIYNDEESINNFMLQYKKDDYKVFIKR